MCDTRSVRHRWAGRLRGAFLCSEEGVDGPVAPPQCVHIRFLPRSSWWAWTTSTGHPFRAVRNDRPRERDLVELWRPPTLEPVLGEDPVPPPRRAASRKNRSGSIWNVADPSLTLYGELLAAMMPDRRAHSLAVGRKVTAAAHIAPKSQRSDLVAAAYLHDIGYCHLQSGFHPIDGAQFLAQQGFSRAVCHLVAHHSASVEEAKERGIDLSVFAQFAVGKDLGRAHAILWWADMTTGP